MDFVKLNNDVMMPKLGIGSFSLSYKDIMNALSIGYRLIDTASQYQNEEEVGGALHNSSIKREDVFITTKIMRPDIIAKRSTEAFENSLRKLQVDYIDLYLIHFPPVGLEKEAWQAMERIYESGRVRAIGISNYCNDNIDIMLTESNCIPVVNQIRSNPYRNNNDLIEYCMRKNIQVEAYSPLGGSSEHNALINEKVILEIAENHKKSSSQVILRWNIQRGLIVIPRSSNYDRMRQNFEVFDFELSDEEMEIINGLNRE